jgi:hypothetical protein
MFDATFSTLKLINRTETMAFKKSVSLMHTRNFKHYDEVQSLFEWHEVIGSGSHGTVVRAIHRKWQREVAVKIISKGYL